MNTLLAVLAALLLGAAQSQSTIGVTTKDGRMLRVQVLGVKDGRAELKILALGGEATTTRDLSDFKPESAYAIQLRATDPKTFEQHFAMAKSAADLDLLSLAGVQARAAVKAAGDGADAEAKKKQVRSWAADALEKMIIMAVAAGDLERATDCLEILTTRLADQRTDEQLAQIEAPVEALREGHEQKQADARAAKLEAKRKADMEKALEPIRSDAAKGDKRLADAIAKSRNTAESARLCDSAVDAYKSAWKQAQELTKKSADDAAMQRELAALTDRVVDQGLRAALHAANVLTMQSDYKAAMDWVNRIINFDPDNEEAQEMKKTIQIAQAAAGSDDYRYGWGRRR